MIWYWLLFLMPAVASMAAAGEAANRRTAFQMRWFFTAVVLTLVIGFRHEVGGDWYAYSKNMFRLQGASIVETLKEPDPLFALLNWVALDSEYGIYLTNLVCGVLFSWGLVAFCKEQPRPWLALTAAVPYMIIVVAMGYSRQGVALGLAMVGLVALGRQKNTQFVVFVVVAALFHKSAVILIPLAILAATRNKAWTAVWIGITGAVMYSLLLEDSLEDFYTNYVEAQYQSEGALIRVAMNIVPAMLFLMLSRKFDLSPQANRLWLVQSIAALGAGALLVISPSSTAVDRIALYLLPLQLFVFSRLPDVMGSARSASLWVLMVVGFYTAVQFTWLNFADHARFWLPYRFYPLELLLQ